MALAALAIAAIVVLLLGGAARIATGDSLADPFRISFSGADGDTNFNAYDPALAYDSRRDRHLAVWCTAVPTAGGGAEKRIFVRLIGADGVPQGSAIAISERGTSSCGATSRRRPRAEWSPSG
jgi:hypothetical protein